MGWAGREGQTPERPRSRQLKVLRIVTDTDGYTTKNCSQHPKSGDRLRRYGFAGCEQCSGRKRSIKGMSDGDQRRCVMFSDYTTHHLLTL